MRRGLPAQLLKYTDPSPRAGRREIQAGPTPTRPLIRAPRPFVRYGVFQGRNQVASPTKDGDGGRNGEETQLFGLSQRGGEEHSGSFASRTVNLTALYVLR